jgi:antitoxin Phd
MIISTNRIVSVTDANQNFNKVAKMASAYGDAVIFKRNKPAFFLVDIEKMGEGFVKEYEKLKLKYISESLLEEYKEAYSVLAK